MFELKFETDNAAFAEGREHEVERIVRSVADQLGFGHTEGTLHDANGNRVGAWTLDLPAVEVEEDDDEEEATELYEVVKFVRDGDNEVIATELTLEDAKATVNGPDTSGDGWFLGYRAM